MTLKVTDSGIEHMISILLRTGVLISGSLVLGGGLYYLALHGGDAANYHQFHSQPTVDRVMSQIVEGAIALRARSVIQLGILLLIATPMARVAFSLVAFALERDRTYVVVTVIVLAVLLFSLIAGAVQG